MDGLILDIILLAVVLLFAVLGARKGLVLSFCSLVAVIVGLLGGCFVSARLTPPLTEQVAQQTQSNTELSNAIENRDNPNFLEDIAREKLDLASPHDRVFYITD